MRLEARRLSCADVLHIRRKSCRIAAIAIRLIPIQINTGGRCVVEQKFSFYFRLAALRFDLAGRLAVAESAIPYGDDQPGRRLVLQYAGAVQRRQRIRSGYFSRATTALAARLVR